MKQLRSPGQDSIRAALRIAGPVVFLIGLICLIIAMVELFTSGMEPPRHFWLGFVGLPLMFVGGVLCMYGFMGAVARYAAGEVMPVAADAARYVAEETKGAVETVSKAAAKGVVEGIDEARARSSEGKD